jgi:hypothetical protein
MRGEPRLHPEQKERRRSTVLLRRKEQLQPKVPLQPRELLQLKEQLRQRERHQLRLEIPVHRRILHRNLRSP